MQVLNVLGAAAMTVIAAAGGAMITYASMKVDEFHTSSDRDAYGNIFTAGIIFVLMIGGMGYELLSRVNP